MTDTSKSTPDNKQIQSDTVPPHVTCLQRRAKETPSIKTPRPKISIGTDELALTSALSSALSSQNLNNIEARRFLRQLGDTIMRSEQGLIFPFAVVEGKGYSTGKQLSEAQNQVAVSRACRSKIQLALSELVKRAKTSFYIRPTPLFFSVCTEGRYHELWADYTQIENDRKFNMALLKILILILILISISTRQGASVEVRYRELRGVGSVDSVVYHLK
ncbi:hypothetical protein MMC29_008378 [Sticta canariensis]|nr:hypothetical protein [Sticta canariensis]